MCVRVGRIKSNGSTKYVELSVEYFWTRVRFPPPPPKYKTTRFLGWFFILLQSTESNPRDAGRRQGFGTPACRCRSGFWPAGQKTGRFPPPPPKYKTTRFLGWFFFAAIDRIEPQATNACCQLITTDVFPLNSSDVSALRSTMHSTYRQNNSVAVVRFYRSTTIKNSVVFIAKPHGNK